MTEKSILDDEYEKFIESYQYYAFEDQSENLQENSQKYEKSYDNNFHNYDDINNIYLVSKEVEHLYNKCDISFLSKNKLFKHLRENCWKFKISFETFNVTFQINNTLFVIFMINNAKVITIIHFIVKLRNVINRSNYNFRN